MQHVFWSEDAEIGKTYELTTWFRVAPSFLSFLKKVSRQYKILGVVLDDEELNLGLIVERKSEEVPDEGQSKT